MISTRTAWLVFAVLIFLTAVVWSAVVATKFAQPPPPVAEQPGAVLRRLELRLSEPLDRTHPVAGGERYRRFECREVPR